MWSLEYCVILEFHFNFFCGRGGVRGGSAGVPPPTAGFNWGFGIGVAWWWYGI